MIKKVLITGIGGSGGSYLAEMLLNDINIEVHGTIRGFEERHFKNIKHIKQDIILHECDLLDFVSVLQIFAENTFDIIFHLASDANVRNS